MVDTLPRLLLHVCCAPCGGYLARELSRDFVVSVYYFNPNIFPRQEYDRRRDEARQFFSATSVEFVEGEYDHKSWLKEAQKMPDEPERGARCRWCYQYRLRATAEQAKSRSCDILATTLTISPHKDASAISRIGQGLAQEFQLDFLDRDFKKDDGFRQATEFSHQHNFYRQHYCGCEFNIT